MVTRTSADQIVRDSIRDVVGKRQNIADETSLREAGIVSPALAKMLQRILLNALAELGFKVLTEWLPLSGQTSVSDLVLAIARAMAQAQRRRPEGGVDGKAPAKKAPTKKTAAKKGAKMPAKKAAKRAAKKAPAKKAPAKKAVKRAAKKAPAKEAVKKAAKKAPAKKGSLMTGIHWAGHGGPTESPVKKFVGIRPPARLSDRGGRGPTTKPIVIRKPPAKKAAESDVTPLPVSPLVTVRATPQVEFSGEVTASNNYPLVVYLDQNPAVEGASVEDVVLELPKELTECRVDIWMDCSAQLKIEGLGENGHVTLQVASGVSDKLKMTLKIVGEAKGEPMYVSAYFRYGGRPCGKITRFLSQGGKRLRWKTQTGKLAAGGVAPPGPDLPAVVIEHGADAADIRVEVTEAQDKDGRHYKLKCFAGAKRWAGLWTLQMKSQKLVKAHMKWFMKAKGTARIASLRGAGLEFWNVLPEEAKTLIAEAIADGAVTMSVLSEEPFVPWELMVPNTTPSDAADSPIGITLQIGRWITGKYIAPPQKVLLRSLFIVSPTESGPPSAADEIKFLLETLKSRWGKSDRLKAKVQDIDNGLAASSRNVLHFVCHGESGVIQTLILDDPDVLTSSMVLAMRGFLSAFKSRPMVFLNACEVGKPVPGLDGVSGFATSFMRLQASAVVAPLWAVQGKAALDVTTRFYSAAFAGIPFARILQEIRKDAYTGEAPPDSYAAYCLYGDPLAVGVTA
jgi:hypothetical protein